MKAFIVTGFALGPIFCRYEVQANNPEHAKRVALARFEAGDRSDCEPERDVGAFCDFEPTGATEAQPNDE